MNTYKPRQTRLKTFTELQNEQDNTPLLVSDAYAEASEIRSSDIWQRLRGYAMSKASGMCVYCYRAAADEVHHIKPVAKFPELAFDLDNLAPLCEECHGFMETRNKRGDDTESQIRKRMRINLGISSLTEVK